MYILLFNNSHSHFNIINRPVGATCCCALNHFNHIKTFLDLAKDGVLTVKMGSAANS